MNIRINSIEGYESTLSTYFCFSNILRTRRMCRSHLFTRLIGPHAIWLILPEIANCEFIKIHRTSITANCHITSCYHSVDGTKMRRDKTSQMFARRRKKTTIFSFHKLIVYEPIEKMPHPWEYILNHFICQNYNNIAWLQIVREMYVCTTVTAGNIWTQLWLFPDALSCSSNDILNAQGEEG